MWLIVANVRNDVWVAYIDDFGNQQWESRSEAEAEIKRVKVDKPKAFKRLVAVKVS